MNKNKTAIVVGTRPNFIKAAPFLLRAKGLIDFDVIHTSQHFDKNMSKIFFDEMEIPKPIILNIDGGFGERLGKMFNVLQGLLSKYKSVIVFGDVNSTLAGAIGSVKNKCILSHIEAGLRSNDRRMPEETNRVIVDHLSDILFTSEPSGEANLLKEGVSPDKIHFVGNIMIESMELFWNKIQQSKITEKIKGIKGIKGRYVISTIHRFENMTKDNLTKILTALKKIDKEIPVIFPIHPSTKQYINNYQLNNLLVKNTIEPLGYFDFMKLLTSSYGVITDSGGIQDETTHLGIPCCTFRDNTERPITIEQGSNKLFNGENIEDVLSHFEKDFRSKHIKYWDNNVSKRILEKL